MTTYLNNYEDFVNESKNRYKITKMFDEEYGIFGDVSEYGKNAKFNPIGTIEKRSWGTWMVYADGKTVEEFDKFSQAKAFAMKYDFPVPEDWPVD